LGNSPEALSPESWDNPFGGQYQTTDTTASEKPHSTQQSSFPETSSPRDEIKDNQRSKQLRPVNNILITCPSCQLEIVPTRDKTCPNCGVNFTTELIASQRNSTSENQQRDPESLLNTKKDPQANVKWLLFSFEGRIARSTFWSAIIGLFLSSLAILIGAGLIYAAIIIYNPLEGDQLAAVNFGCTLLFSVLAISLVAFALKILIAIAVKRCHDLDKSGAWILFSLLPIIGPLWVLFELGYLEGTKGRNQYGEGPRDTLIM
jgi:uncharacterized membrane protein YhaH (DUF805 family)